MFLILKAEAQVKHDTKSVAVKSKTADKFNKGTFSFNGTKVSKKKFNNFLDSQMRNLNIPGVAIAIINKGKVVLHTTIGYANLEQKLAVNNKTIFEGASMSKSVFAFFVMTYVEEGKLDLDKPLYEYLPYDDIAYDERYKKITARMVLSHRTGFPNWREDENDKKLKIKFEPGTDYSYSGEGYQYLTFVLKQLEGTDWNGLEAAFQRRVAKPLRMKHTVFIQTPYTVANKAEPYKEKYRRHIWKSDYWFKRDKDRFVGAASIHSEPIDFSKWMIAVMNRKLLSAESYNQLFKPHSNLDGLIKGSSVHYSLGFVTSGTANNTIFFHSGKNSGFTSKYILNEEKDWGYVIFTNSESCGDLETKIFEYLVPDKKPKNNN